MNLTQVSARNDRNVAHDRGFSLVELVIVVVILGILATVAVFAVGGITAEAEDSSCQTEARILITAGEAYFTQHATRALPDAGGADGFEQTLVDSGLLRQTSEYYDLDADGELVQVSGSNCTV